MALFGGSSKKSTSITDIDTTTVGASEGSQAFNVSGGELTFTDQGAIGRAFDFAAASLGLAGNTVTAARRANEDALSATLSSINESTSGGARTLMYTVLGIAAAIALGLFAFKKG